MDQIQSSPNSNIERFKFVEDDIEWDNLIINSKEDRKMPWKPYGKEHAAYNYVTMGGKSLLQICIENE